MKKASIFIGLFVALTSTCIAQENETDNREKFQFGAKAGLNYSNVYDEKGDQFNADAKFGMAGGLFMDIPFGKYMGLQPAVMVSQKGFRGTGQILGNKYDFTRTTTFLEFPILFEFKPSEFFTLVAGPQYSYLLYQRDVFANATTSIAQEQEFVNDNIRKNIFGFGGGFDINLRHVTLGARASWDVQNNNGDGTSSTPRYKNICFQGTVGYKLYK